MRTTMPPIFVDEVISVNPNQGQPSVAMKITAYSALVLSTILVFAWPLFLMFSAFIFDAPITSKFDETKRFALLIYVLSYPVGLLVGIGYVIARRIGKPKGRTWCTKWTVFLFLLPIIQLSVPLLIVAVASTFVT
jgi:hypothetical protein